MARIPCRSTCRGTAALLPWALVVLSAAFGAGCGAGRGREASLQPSRPAANAAGRGDAGVLLSSADRKRLQALCAERSAGGHEDGYRLGPDDLIEIRVPDLLEPQGQLAAAASGGGAPGRAAMAGAPSFQQGLRVDAAGNVSVPTIGQVRAGGLTASELEREIARKLVAGGILDAPQVSVLIVEYRSRIAAVVGSVERPGMYPVTSGGTSLADLIWVAGGPTRDAGRVVQFTPAVAGRDGKPFSAGAAPAAGGAPVRIDLDLLLHAQGPDACNLDPPARPGDIISLSPAGSVQVTGWVDKPGTVPVTRGLTVTGAIAAAGGELFAADPETVVVKRVLGPGDERSWTVDLNRIAAGEANDVPLTDGDVVTVPAANAKLVPYGMWTLTKEVIHIGGSVPLF